MMITKLKKKNGYIRKLIKYVYFNIELIKIKNHLEKSAINSIFYNVVNIIYVIIIHEI